MTEIQKITLRDILTTSGLTERQVEDIFLLLRFKPERVRLAFYYRAQGMTLDEVGVILEYDKRMAHYYINECLADVEEYLKDKVTK